LELVNTSLSVCSKTKRVTWSLPSRTNCATAVLRKNSSRDGFQLIVMMQAADTCRSNDARSGWYPISGQHRSRPSSRRHLTNQPAFVRRYRLGTRCDVDSSTPRTGESQADTRRVQSPAERRGAPPASCAVGATATPTADYLQTSNEHVDGDRLTTASWCQRITTSRGQRCPERANK